ncbi:MAG: hypothetical protein IT562_19420 [Alphaproteobacteria bacterium]|nr:hypothetical protein [Alphaproteobacteria bacterium]
MSAVIAYRNEPHQKFYQVMLDSGEQVMLRIDPTGLTIERLISAKAPGAMLFHADADRGASIAKALATAGLMKRDKVLDILVAAVVKLGSAEKIGAAFRAASGKAA